MASLLAFEALLEPIAGDNPGGQDLRKDTSPTSVYFRIKDARAAARAAERRLETEEEPAGWPDEWRTILEVSPKVIAEQSKDLEITAWLIEALVRAHGFAGLRDGFRLARELADKYWDNLYPVPDEEGVVTRIAPLIGLNGEGGDGTLILPIRKVAITDSRESGIFSTWHYDQASDLVKVADPAKRQTRIDAGAATLEQVVAAVATTTTDFYRALVADLEGCLDEFDRLHTLLDGKCGSDAPPSSNIRNALNHSLDIVRLLTKDRLTPIEAATEAPQAGATEVGAAKADGPVRSREDAFRALLDVAAFFRKTEPHSVIALAIEDIVRRGRMPLSDLVSELIPDQAARDGFFMRAGIKPPAGTGG